jgi:Microtubule associated protein 1A/1B, light chain 3.
MDYSKENSGYVPVVMNGRNDVYKFLVPESLSFSEFVFFFRKKLKMEKRNAIYLEIGGRNFLSFNTVIGDLHKLYKAKDNHLYIKFTTEEYLG